MMAVSEHDTQAAALQRAREHGIRVARLSDELWRAESIAPLLRGPYLCAVLPDGDSHCECPAGTFHESICHHRAAVLAAIAGDYPVSDLDAICGPGEAPEGETPEQRRQRLIRAYDAATARRRAAAVVTADDYRLFDYGE